jgi:putative toxin-antitoxin system antitoxin component (TIGR02293 family)
MAMLTEPNAVAGVLGLRTSSSPTTPFHLIASIENGLPVGALDRLAKTIAPGEAEFKHRFVSKATLARRKRDASARLTVEESDRLARIATIWAHALVVWKSEESARAFLFRPHPMLEGRRPIDAALATELGADLVDQILGGLEHGSAV